MTRSIEPMPHYHQLHGNHWANLWHRSKPEVDEPDPDDGMRTIDDYDPELNMNEDAPVSYYEGPDTWEEAEGLR
jgi:hypothetical protein